MPEREEVERRFAEAKSDARSGRDGVKKASRVELDRLLALPVDDRFAALAKPDLPLTDAHRRELVRSVKETRPPKSPIAINTATKWAIWRSRLRFRVFSVASITAGLIVVGGHFLVALNQTPKQLVESAFDYDVQGNWRISDGRVFAIPIKPGVRYQLVRIEAEYGDLRLWSPPFGYGEMRVPLAWLQAVREAP